MKMTVAIEPICPFVRKECIGDGWQRWDQKIIRPCAFWDGDRTFNGVSPDEPCRLKRALNRILSDEVDDKDRTEPIVVRVPWPTEKE